MTITPLQRVPPASARTAAPEAISRRRGYAVVIAVGAVVFWLAYDAGTYGIQSRSIVAIVAWWLLALAVISGRWPLMRLRWEAITASVALAGFALLSLLSITWASSDVKAFLEFNRVALYVAILLLSFTIGSRSVLGRICDGLLLGVSATVALALFSRLFPHVVNASAGFDVLPRGVARLNYPLGNWNALAVFAAMAIPFALRSALLGSSSLTRGVAIAPVPAIAAAIYLTSSRTGAALAALAIACFFFLVQRRLATLGVMAVAAVGSAGAVAAVAAAHPVAVGRTVPVWEGLLVATLVAVACLVTGATVWMLSPLLRDRPSGRRPSIERWLVLAGIAAFIVAVVAAHPIQRFDDFKRLPVGTYGNTDEQYVLSHLLSSSGNGRWQFWTAAVREFEAHPIGGGGAGSFEAWWVKTRPYAAFVRNAHSLYLETLGELGVVGLALIVAVFGAGVAAIALRLRARDDSHRATIAALGATLVVFIVGAGLDWSWQVTVVTIVGLLSLGLLVGPATADPPARPPRSWARLAAGVAVAALALPVIVSQMFSFLTDRRLATSEHAYNAGRLDDAFKAANSARNLEPWSDEPYVQLALVSERAGDLSSAAAWIGGALSRDPDNWSSWLIQARVQVKLGQIIPARRSLSHARELNPLGFADATR